MNAPTLEFSNVDAPLFADIVTMAAIRQRSYPFLFVGTYREALIVFAA